MARAFQRFSVCSFRRCRLFLRTFFTLVFFRLLLDSVVSSVNQKQYFVHNFTNGFWCRFHRPIRLSMCRCDTHKSIVCDTVLFRYNKFHFYSILYISHSLFSLTRSITHRIDVCERRNFARKIVTKYTRVECAPNVLLQMKWHRKWKKYIYKNRVKETKNIVSKQRRNEHT